MALDRRARLGTGGSGRRGGTSRQPKWPRTQNTSVAQRRYSVCGPVRQCGVWPRTAAVYPRTPVPVSVCPKTPGQDAWARPTGAGPRCGSGRSKCVARRVACLKLRAASHVVSVSRVAQRVPNCNARPKSRVATQATSRSSRRREPSLVASASFVAHRVACRAARLSTQGVP